MTMVNWQTQHHIEVWFDHFCFLPNQLVLIYYAVNFLFRFMEKPTKSHMQGAKKLLNLHGKLKLKTVYWKQEDRFLLEKSNADWSGDQNDQKSFSAFHLKLCQHSGAISWQMRKEHTVALSSSEAEYQGLAAAAWKIIFLRQILCDLKHPQQQPTSLGEDNQSAIELSTNPVFHKRWKHIDMKQHILKDAAQ